MRITVFKTGGNAGSGGFVSNGLVLQGPLILSGSYSEPLHAVPKQYVDNVAYNLDASNITSGVLPAGRLPAFTGDATTILGSTNIILSATGVTPGSVVKPTVDAKGRVVSSGVLVDSDIGSVGFNKITANKPNTLNGYNITNGIKLSSDTTLTGSLILHADPVNPDHAATKQYVDSSAGQASGISVGDIIRKPYSTTPTGFLKCNGAELDKTTYANLYSVIGDTFAINFNNGAGRPWQQQYQINEIQKDPLVGWDSSTLPTTLGHFSTFVTKNRVYVCGGFVTTGSAYTAAVYTSLINADGTLAGWTTATSLPVIFSHSTPIVTKNRVYLIGGLVAGGYNSVVCTAPINSDGTVGTWKTSGALPSNLASSNAIVIQNKVYLLGGNNGSANISVIYTATISDDGTLGSWSVYGSLPISVSMHGVAVIRNRVYLLGGSTAAGAVSSVYSNTINTDASLGNWNLEVSLPVKVYGSTIFVSKNRVYLIAGASSTTVSTNTIYSAAINSDGSLGTWEVSGNLPGVTSLNGCFATKNKLFVIGGIGSASAYSNAVYSTNISGGLNDYSSYYGGNFVTANLTTGSGQPWLQQYQMNVTQSGNISGWSTGTAFPVTTRQAQIAVTKNRVYILSGILNGGYSAAIYSAAINADGTLGAWGTTTSLPGNRNGANIIITKNRINIIGGDNGSGVQSASLTAPINSDGTLGAWTTGTSMPTSKYLANSIVTKGRVYTFGGYNGNGYINLVCSAPINADGTIGTWVAESNLPNPLASTCPVIIGSKVYLIGGFNGSVALSTILSAGINADGTIGSWVAETSLPGIVQQANAFVTKNTIYIIGSSGTTAIQYYAPINSDGTIGTWVTGTAPSLATTNACVFATSSRLYSLGGMVSGAAVSTVFSAPINGLTNDYSPYYDGSNMIGVTPINYMMPGSGQPWRSQYQINSSQSDDITGWTTDTAFPTGLYYACSFVTKNRVYVLGGNSATTTYLSTVYTATINSDGTLGTWTTDTALPAVLSFSQAIVTKNRVYLLGGRQSSTYVSTVYTTSINTDGTIGAWTTGTALPGVLSHSHAFITKNRVYLCGGQTVSGNAVTTVYTTQINSDGTLGSWTTGIALPGALAWGQAIVTNNRVYLLGGWNGTAYVSTVYTATINSDGTLGAWTTDTALPVIIGWTQSVVTKNKVYLIGGYNGTNSLSSIYTSTINTDGTLGSWVAGTALPGLTASSQVVVTKNHLYVIGGNNGVGASSVIYMASILEGLNDYSPYYDGTIQPFAIVSTTFRLPDYSMIDREYGEYVTSYIKF